VLCRLGSSTLCFFLILKPKKDKLTKKRKKTFRHLEVVVLVWVVDGERARGCSGFGVMSDGFRLVELLVGGDGELNGV